MQLQKFNDLTSAEEFLKIYSVQECIINITTMGEILVWIDELKTIQEEDILCEHCNRYTDATGKFCAWCGNQLYKE